MLCAKIEAEALAADNSNSPRYTAAALHGLNSRRLSSARQQSRSECVAIHPIRADRSRGIGDASDTSRGAEGTQARRLSENAERFSFECLHASCGWRTFLQR
jgi:hypothetical protein